MRICHNPVFVKLQASTLLISTQSSLLEVLSTEICTIIEIPGYFSDEDVAGEFSVTYGRWFGEYSEIVLFIESLAMHSRHILQTLNDELHCKVLHSIGHLCNEGCRGRCQHPD